jgi:hypothetical protein
MGEAILAAPLRFQTPGRNGAFAPHRKCRFREAQVDLSGGLHALLRAGRPSWTLHTPDDLPTAASSADTTARGRKRPLHTTAPPQTRVQPPSETDGHIAQGRLPTVLVRQHDAVGRHRLWQGEFGIVPGCPPI